jgi:hypothetical protein
MKSSNIIKTSVIQQLGDVFGEDVAGGVSDPRQPVLFHPHVESQVQLQCVDTSPPTSA